MSTKLALFPPQGSPDELPPPRRGSLMQPDWVTSESSIPISDDAQENEGLQPLYGPWVKPEPGLEMWPGDILPSVLLYHSEFAHLPLLLTEEFLSRWDAILSTFPFDDRDHLATAAKFIKVNQITRYFEMVDPKDDPGPQTGQDLFLARLPEFGPVLDRAYRTMPFGEGKRNLDINFSFFTENENVFGILGFF
ncbi:hypothetical protein FLAG1_05642 [Fusarium langsethiae]|uniref:Uncharacterized protein n=1 Tax=Fusarium langsethiae TaxID=179993 RepID=A0A0M9EWR4_FUSLA|nr:hypothetical protein FLAG1_05642 [Fusarium langsethiae]GKU13064.1 unnamed protein product [Fusarium langsethiae]